jgi:hypothetical protein
MYLKDKLPTLNMKGGENMTKQVQIITWNFISMRTNFWWWGDAFIVKKHANEFFETMTKFDHTSANNRPIAWRNYDAKFKFCIRFSSNFLCRKKTI